MDFYAVIFCKIDDSYVVWFRISFKNMSTSVKLFYKYWVSQIVHLGFPIRCYGKTSVNFLTNPILIIATWKAIISTCSFQPLCHLGFFIFNLSCAAATIMQLMEENLWFCSVSDSFARVLLSDEASIIHHLLRSELTLREVFLTPIFWDHFTHRQSPDTVDQDGLPLASP